MLKRIPLQPSRLNGTNSTVNTRKLPFPKSFTGNTKETVQHDFILQAKTLKTEILKNSKILEQILSEIQPYKVTTYEVERSLKTLDSVEKNLSYFGKKVDKISVFMPSNLPLYSFILFGIIPSFMVNQKIYIKPNQLMRGKNIYERIFQVLDLHKLFPKIEIINHETQLFLNEFVPSSDIVIFTGYNKNRDKILSLIKPGALLIYNGSGHNPIIVGEEACVEKAAKDCCYARFFNSGQDCAGPDAILVHESIFEEFMNQYLQEIENLKVGIYADENTDVGPIERTSELQKFLKLLSEAEPENIVAGGVIDLKQKIMYPTVVTALLDQKCNFEEVFGPISFVYSYKNEDDVSLYFGDPNGTYMRNKMYVSLYGNNSYVSDRDDAKLAKRNGIGIVLYESNVHDFEVGDKAYGGYSIGASAIFYKDPKNGSITSKALPIYIPEIIAQHVEQKNFDCKNVNRSDQTIAKAFRVKVARLFGDNLHFAFIFGSFAQGNAKFSSSDASDLDVFICLKSRSCSQEELFKKWIIKFQWENELKPDLEYCCEFISIAELEESLERLVFNPFNPYHNDERAFDSAIYLCALAGPKTAIVGDRKALSKLTAQANQELRVQANHFISSMENNMLINRKILLSLNGMRQEETLEFLRNCSKRGEHARILREFVPFGEKKIVASQDDLNYCKEAGYVKVSQNCLGLA